MTSFHLFGHGPNSPGPGLGTCADHKEKAHSDQLHVPKFGMGV